MQVFLICLLALLTAGCSTGVPSHHHADLIFHGSHIVTMDPEQPTVEAVAVRGKTIVAAGELDEVMAMRCGSTRVVDLGDQALLPGFIDAHGHMIWTGRVSEGLSLHPPPVGDVETIDDIVQKIRAWIKDKQIPPGQLVVGVGYDDSLLKNGRHPTRYDLDRASTEHPIILSHVSGHLQATNSNVIEASKITGKTEAPAGGKIRLIEGTNTPSGVFEGKAMGLLVTPPSPKASADLDEVIHDAIKLYAAYGTTTIQDGGGNRPSRINAYLEAAERRPFDADVVLYTRAEALLDGEVTYSSNYRNGLRVAGAKIFLDGSPQGRTAWMTKPYKNGPPEAPADYVAYSRMDPDLYKSWAKELMQRGIPFQVHSNGDAAIDLMMDGVEHATQALDTERDHRSVIIHAQLMREDQVKRAKVNGVIPSFFVAHAYFWGDWHVVSFGQERGSNISPIGWAVEHDVPFTIHNDSPVVPPDILRLVSIAVNRETRSGRVLGPDQRATVYQALHATTLGAAYQYAEENIKGSITVGKQADLVILGENPLTVDPRQIANIPIIETIARGKTIYLKQQGVLPVLGLHHLGDCCVDMHAPKLANKKQE